METGYVLILGERHAIRHFKYVSLKYIALNKECLDENTLRGKAINKSFG